MTTYTQISLEHNGCWLAEGILPDCIETEELGIRLWNDRPEEKGLISIFGKQIEVPRYFRSYGMGYNFSGSVNDGFDVPDYMYPIWEFVNELGYGMFDQCLVNWYPDGDSSIGRHRDDESSLLPNSPIVAISICQKCDCSDRKCIDRKLRIRKYHATKAGEILYDALLPDRSFLVMGGHFQQKLTHEIPKTKRSKHGRVSLTFRRTKNLEQ